MTDRAPTPPNLDFVPQDGLNPAVPDGDPAPGELETPNLKLETVLASAADSHARLSRLAARFEAALLARTEARLDADQLALDTGQISTGVTILRDLVSIQKSLLTNQFLIQRLAAQRAVSSSDPNASGPTTSANDAASSNPNFSDSNPACAASTTQLETRNSELATSIPSNPSAPSASAAQLETRNSKLATSIPSIPSTATSLIPDARNPQSPIVNRQSSILSVPSVAVCRRLPFHEIEPLLSRLALDIQAYPAAFSAAWLNAPRPNYRRPSPDCGRIHPADRKYFTDQVRAAKRYWRPILAQRAAREAANPPTDGPSSANFELETRNLKLSSRPPPDTS